jgi:hypothetical protein
MTLLQKLIKILQDEMEEALKTDDVDRMSNALVKVQSSEPRVYFEKKEEQAAMKVCTKAIEEAIASGSDEEIKSKLSAAKMLLQQHNEAYKIHPSDPSKGKKSTVERECHRRPAQKSRRQSAGNRKEKRGA